MSAAPGTIYFGQYSSSASAVAVPSHASCWALVGATPFGWDGAAGLVANAWADMTANSYSDYCLGENFTIVANEDYPMITTEDRPLTIPPDSGFSQP